MYLTKAESIENVYRAFSANPLDKDDLAFFSETHSARGGKPFRKRILQRLNTINDVDYKYLMVGYRGCGKSTELAKLQEEIEHETTVRSRHLVLSYSIKNELDPVNLNYIQLFIITMEKLFETIENNKLPLNQEYLTQITHWVKSTEIQKINDTYNLYEGTAKFDIPFFKNFFANFRLSSTRSTSMKEVIKQSIEPRLSELINLCNGLITEVKLGLHKIDKDNLLIIIEDFDKITYDKAKEIFIDHVSTITQLNVNMIFTFPISLYYSAWWSSQIKNYFHDYYEFPMIKVHEKDGSDSPEGMSCMQDMIEKRMNFSLFESKEILNAMIRMSGGALWDLFRLIRDAADFAIDENREQISQKDYQKALEYLINDYQNTITDVTIEGKLYLAERFYEILVQLAKTKTFENSIEMLHLRQTLLVLGYNGDFWCDIHPVVKEILERKNKI